MITTLHGDCRDILPTLAPGSVQCIVTSPPYYGLRDYGTATWEGGSSSCDHRSPTMRPGRNEDRPMLAGSAATNAAQLILAAQVATCGKCGARRIDRQIGLEASPHAYVEALVDVFRACWRVLRDDGTLWLNLGDSYANDTKWGGKTSGKHVGRLHGDTGIGRRRTNTGLRSKNLIGIPWRVAFALQDDGWILRSEIIWSKPNPMPESITDRPTRSHEYLFLFAKEERYYYDADAIAEPVQRSDRPQYQRAVEIALAHGLTNEHIDAIRAAGLTDTGKNAATQTGTGANSERVQQLAAEAKAVLKGYYREFLSARSADSFKRTANKRSTPIVPGSHNATHRNDREDEHYAKLTRNRRSVWTIPTRPYADAHFAVFPEALVEPCILAGSRPGDTVLDPFAGSGTTMRVAERLQRNSIGIDLNADYIQLQHKRTDGVQVEMVGL